MSSPGGSWARCWASRPRDAEEMLDLAWHLEVNLPGTKAAFRAGILSRDKAAIIAAATALLDPDEARAAEAMVLDRAGSLTPAALRAAIGRAVMEVNPEKARKRREHAARRTRVERWAEDCGNAGPGRAGTAPGAGAGRRPAGHRLGQAAAQGGPGRGHGPAPRPGLPGPSARHRLPAPGQQPGRHAPPGRHGGTGRGDGPDGCGPGEPRDPAPTGPLAGVIPPGFAGRVNLTIPAATLLDLADRPGEMAGIGPIDPDLARDLAAAAARSARSTWCVTVTDQPGPRHRARLRPARTRRRSQTPRQPGHTRRPRRTGPARPAVVHLHPRRSARPAGRVRDLAVRPPGSPGSGTGSSRSGRSPPDDCDHRHEANGHDPGVMLRHLAQVRHATCTGPGCRRPSVAMRFRAQHPVRSWRQNVHVQREPEVPVRSPGKAGSALARGATRKCGTSGGPRRRDGSTSPNQRATRYRGSSGVQGLVWGAGARLGCRGSSGVQGLVGGRGGSGCNPCPPAAAPPRTAAPSTRPNPGASA